jgi:predicted ATPase
VETTTRLIGRRREIAVLDELVAAGRLVTVTGPPGVGKSSLLRELAARAPAAIVCDLTACRSASDVEHALQRGLGGVSRARLARALSSFSGIVLLDRFEHLIERARSLVDAWTSGAGPSFVIGSREPIGLAQEQVLVLEPLDDDDAVALYAARARRSIDREAARALVRRLDRLPLAIELAAALAPVLSDDEIVARLERGLLAIDTPSATLRATVRWSLDMLAEAERETLLRCGVFSGSFEARVAEAVVGRDVAAHLAALEKKSLVRSEATSGAPRLRLYDAVREVAREELARGQAEIEDRHARYYVGLVQRALDSADPALSRTLSDELGDLAAAAAHTSDPAARATLALGIDLASTGQPPTDAHLAMLGSAIAAAEGASDDELLARALLARARARRLVGEARAAVGDLRRALAIARARRALRLEADVLRLLGVLARQLSHPRRARIVLSRALAIYEETQQRDGAMVVHDDLGVVAHDLGDATRAREHYERALALERVVGDRRFEGITLLHLGLVAYDVGDVEHATAYYAEALAIHRATGDRRFEGFALAASAALALERGELDDARRSLDDAAAIDARLGTMDSGVLLAGLECAFAAATGAIARAHEIALRARSELSRRDDAGLSHMLDVFASAIGIAEANRANVEKRFADEAAHVEAVERALAPSPSTGYLEEKLARRVVSRLLASRPGAMRRVVVASDGEWFTCGAERVSLARRRSLALLLARLAGSPGRSVAIDDLFAAGWPGERVPAASAKRRVYVGIDTLRSLGLRDAILQHERGYMLAPNVEIALNEV